MGTSSTKALIGRRRQICWRKRAASSHFGNVGPERASERTVKRPPVVLSAESPLPEPPDLARLRIPNWAPSATDCYVSESI